MNGLLEKLKQNAMIELSVQRKNVDIIERAKAHAKTEESGDEEVVFEVAVDEAPAEETASKKQLWKKQLQNQLWKKQSSKRL